MKAIFRFVAIAAIAFSFCTPANSKDESKSYPQLGCESCKSPTRPVPMKPMSTDPHILAAVKMANGGTGCSATVVGDTQTFRKYKKVLIVSAGHCVSGNIGKKATFYNPDGETSFEAELIAFDRHIDASLFVADSSGPLSAIRMADPGDFDQNAKFSSCNYPAASGGPNYKLCDWVGTSDRDGADEGLRFDIQHDSLKHGGHFSGGGSGGSLDVQPANSTEWLFFSATTHGAKGTVICTPKHDEIYKFMCDNAPADDCGPWCRKCPPKRPPNNPNNPTDPGNKPPWWKPNVPIDPPQKPPGEVAPPPPAEPGEPPPKPVVVPDPKVTELQTKIEQLQKQIVEIKIGQSQPGPIGPSGTPGLNGHDGKDATLDEAKVNLQVQALVRAQVDALIASGALKGPKGDPGEAGEPGAKGDKGDTAVVEKQIEGPRILYFTSRNLSSRTGETDAIARSLKNAGKPVTIITLDPTEINEANVRDVPRVFTLPEGRSIVGSSEVAAFLKSKTP